MIFRDINSENFSNTINKIYNHYLFLLFVSGFSLAIFSKSFFILFTNSRYYSSILFVPFLIISVILSGINTYLEVLLVARGRQGLLGRIIFITALVSLSLNLILIKILGIYGCIIASLGAYLISNIICHYYTSLSNRKLLHQFILFIIIAFLPNCINLNNIIFEIIIKISAIIIFTLISIKFFNIGFDNLIKYKIYKKLFYGKKN